MHIVVVGAANIDIITKSKTQIVSKADNPADVVLTAGGAARNITAILASQGTEVSLIAAVGNDPFGSLLRENCTDIGINTDAWIVKNNISTGVHIAALENNGDLYSAFSAITAPESIRTAEITKHKTLIKEADLLILDLNLTEKILAVLVELRDGNPIMVDAVSVDKVLRLEGLLDKIDVLKLNRLEAERLTGITLDTKERVKQAGYSIVSKGAQRVFITLGMAGVCAVDNHNAIFVPALPIVVKNATGAGAAFSAGLALRFTKDLRGQAESGVALAAEHLGSIISL
ncbi:MAG: PfkB family carbohydrate kinase [Oscillospiraceae bacterium]|jgi:pseudouridine kinase|nr:PfkB family carbohydrate kinase [Oscillospiraceae bacterium]